MQEVDQIPFLTNHLLQPRLHRIVTAAGILKPPTLVSQSRSELRKVRLARRALTAKPLELQSAVTPWDGARSSRDVRGL